MKVYSGSTCTGGPNGDACIVRCRNAARAGPFGGCAAVTNATPAGGAAGNATAPAVPAAAPAAAPATGTKAKVSRLSSFLHQYAKV